MVIVKWIKGFLNHPFRIIKSLYYRTFNKETYLAYKRLKICNKCTNKIKNKVVGDYCNLCGCILLNKTRLTEETCDMNKW